MQDAKTYSEQLRERVHATMLRIDGVDNPTVEIVAREDGYPREIVVSYSGNAEQSVVFDTLNQKERLRPSGCALTIRTAHVDTHDYEAHIASGGSPRTAPGFTASIVLQSSDPLHPTGKCRCAGEGTCEWCMTPTVCGCTNATCGGCGDGDDPDLAAAQLDVALTLAAPAVAVLDRAEDALARLRYPLYCVDRGEMFNDAQFVGPYATHDEAQQHAGPDDLIARCRCLRPSEIRVDFDLDVADCETPSHVADVFDQAVGQGESPETAWYAWTGRVVHLEIDDGTLPTASDFREWADEHLRADVYICEGDE